jgi:molybdopterin-binding protein
MTGGVIVTTSWPERSDMKYGARNQIEGIVKRVKKGAVMAQVDLDVPKRGVMSSVLTVDSLMDLKLKKGDRVRVIVKAIHVLLVKD